MRHRLRPACSIRLLQSACGLLFVALWAVASTASAAAPTPWRVAILLGTDPALPAVQQHDRALRAALQAAAPNGVVFFTDTLDAMRFDYRDVSTEFLALQRRKYAEQPVDLVIGVGERAIDLVRDQRDAVWPGVPIVLSALDDATMSGVRLGPDTATVRWRLDVEGTLAIAGALQPDATRVVVLGGTSPFDRDLVERVTRLATALPRLRVETWTDLTADDAVNRLGALDARSIVMFTSMNLDASGRPRFPSETLTRLAAASGAPIYGLFGSYLGRGLTAGSVVDFESLGRYAALAAIARLQSASRVSALQTAVIAPSRCMADHTWLERHRLDAAALPPGCDLLNPPRTLWTEYRNAVLVAGAVVVLQTLSIGGLLMQRRRRRTAEAEAVERQLELARAMRFAAMGELTASIAHEINQPLGAILANAEAADRMLAAGSASPQMLREILADIRRDDLRAHEVIQRLRALLEKHEVIHAPMALHPTLREAIALIEPEARRRGIAIDTRLEATRDGLLGDPVQLQQVVLNLMLNAFDAMQATSGPQRHLAIATADADGSDDLVLTVADRGHGLTDAQRQGAFRSFWTTKPNGLGLGLPIVRAIVEAHHGRVTLEPRAGGGAIATVRLPRQAASAPQPVGAQAPAGVEPGASGAS